MNESLHLWLIPLLPFAGFVLNGILGRRLPKSLVTAVALLAPLGAFGVVLNAAIASASGLALPHVETYGQWINAGPLHVDFSFVLDHLSLVMLLIVTGVGFLIHVYSVGYMHDDKGYWRYFSYLNLFLFFMTVLVLAGKCPADVCRLGRRGPRVVSAHRLLVSEENGRRRRQEGLHRQPHRRLRLPDRHVPAAGQLRHAHLQRDRRQTRRKPGMDRRHSHRHLPLPAARRNRQERAVAALCLAARCDGRPHAGLRADPRGHHGHGGRLHDCPHSFPL